MSTIVHARDDDGSGLTDDELIAFFALLFPAGAETTRSALGRRRRTPSPSTPTSSTGCAPTRR